MKKRILIIISSVASISLLGAAYALFLFDHKRMVDFSVMESTRTRAASPNVSDAEIQTLVDDNNAFAFDLYQALKETDGNLFYSPFSISLALAMTFAGARGETAEQMAETLQFILPQDSLHTAFNSLDSELAGCGEGADGRDGEGFRLNIVNAIWGQKDYRFLSKFLDVLGENYGAGLKLLDFVNAPENSHVTINDWISRQTKEQIIDLIPPKVIDTLTRLVLTNAIHFNAAWQIPFQNNATRYDAFHLLDGDKIILPMMIQTDHFGFAEGNGYQLIELLYDGGELSMLILLPEPSRFEEFEEVMTAQMISSTVERLKRYHITLIMPKFEFESDFSLKETLMTMGMPLAFSMEKADFSGMTGERELFIQDVIHKAFIFSG